MLVFFLVFYPIVKVLIGFSAFVFDQNICKVQMHILCVLSLLLFLSCINIQYSVMCWLSPSLSQKKFACVNILEMLRGYASYFLQEDDV